MLPVTPNYIPVTEQLDLIEKLKDVELCRNVGGMRSLLNIFWQDFAADPDLSFCRFELQAEFLRFCGVYLNLAGQAESLPDYTARGKDLLTRAVELYEELQNRDKAAETRVQLAFCYWNTGEYLEAESILKSVEDDFGENILHPVYQQICINRIMICFGKKEFPQACRLIDKIEKTLAFSPDERLKSMFHNHAGMIYNALNEFEKAEYHLKEAIRNAQKAGNSLFAGANLNNLAFLYLQKSDLANAFAYIEDSIGVFKKISNFGCFAQALDTKALIQLKDGEPDAALRSIDEAIAILQAGDDCRALTDAMWTRCRCLFRLGRSAEAVGFFAKLYSLAERVIGEQAAERFTSAFEDDVYVIKNLPLLDELDEFKKRRVEQALRAADGKITEAANLLGLKKHQTLSQILNKQFPLLYESLGYERRAVRGTKKKAANEKKKSVSLKPSQIRVENQKKISQIVLPRKEFLFEFNLGADRIETYLFGSGLMKQFGFGAPAVVAVVPVQKLVEKSLILARYEDRFYFGRIEFDSEYPIIRDEHGFPIILDEQTIVGEPVGYCPHDGSNKKIMEFSRLKRL